MKAERIKKLRGPELQKAVERLIALCEENPDILPTDYRLAELLRTGAAALDPVYAELAEGWTPRARALRKLIEYRSECCVRGLLSGKAASGPAALMKDRRWGGLRDEAAPKQAVILELRSESGEPLTAEDIFPS